MLWRDVFSGAEIAYFGIGRRVLAFGWCKGSRVLVPLQLVGHGCVRPQPPGLGRILETSGFSALWRQKNIFFILQGAVLYQSAFVAEFVHGGTFCPSSCTNLA